MNAIPVADFCPVAVHIGRELKKRIKASGIPITRVARELRTSPQSLHAWFKKESCDTDVLLVASKLLHFDFFKLYSADLGLEPVLSLAAEPAATYQRKPDTMEITIKTTTASGDVVERIMKAVEQPVPGPGRDKLPSISRSTTTRNPRRARGK